MSKELYHHGILGMKWGVRRYQPYPDGHVGGKEIGEAAKARKRASSMSDEELTKEVKRLNLEKQYNKMTEEKAKPSKLESTRDTIDSASKFVNKAKDMNQNSINSSRKKETLDLRQHRTVAKREKVW